MLKSATSLVIALAVLGAFGLLYSDVLLGLVHDWAIDDNYSHGFLIVPIALYFAWERRSRLAAAPVRPSAWGLVFVGVSMAVLAAGVLGAEFFLARVSMLGVLAGAIVFLLGWQHLKILWFPIAFLLLMVPIPTIVFNEIALPLQLLASRVGETALSLFDVPVLREGNVLVLANTRLEVAEACSGIRSLVSLLTLAIVYGYFIDSRVLARVTLALAAIPIAIVANGVRVAGAGLAAHYIGPSAAEGFIHTFSGWLVFLVAFAMLFAAQRGLSWLWPTTTVASSGADPFNRGGGAYMNRKIGTRAAVLVTCMVFGAVLIARASRTEAVPPRLSLDTFPLQVGAWTAQPTTPMDSRVLAQLRVDDYLNRTYAAAGEPTPVGFYVGYYATQRQGQTMHSPLNCLPGAGWEPTRKERPSLVVEPAESTAPRPVVVNRLIIQKGLDKQVVLYWYQSHGRVEPSEYWGKVFTVLDAIRLNRTDAAMVRVIAPVVGDGEANESNASTRAARFAALVFPALARYLPN